jgi:hypothetical protein
MEGYNHLTARLDHLDEKIKYVIIPDLKAHLVMPYLLKSNRVHCWEPIEVRFVGVHSDALCCCVSNSAPRQRIAAIFGSRDGTAAASKAAASKAAHASRASDQSPHDLTL